MELGLSPTIRDPVNPNVVSHGDLFEVFVNPGSSNTDTTLVFNSRRETGNPSYAMINDNAYGTGGGTVLRHGSYFSSLTSQMHFHGQINQYS
jgi:hypothetical protein